MLLRRTAAALALVLGFIAGLWSPAAGAAGQPFDDVIALPDGYRPEGIASAGGTRFFVGSIPTGAVSVGDARTGAIDPLVPATDGRAAIGLEEAGGMLFVAGGATGKAFVYDARTGEDVATLTLAPPGDTFINDVVVTTDAAWFTDSRSLTLSRVDRRTLAVSTLPLTGISLSGSFNLNGIEASPDGRTLLVIQSSTATLYAIDAATGAAEAVDAGGYAFTNGDGLLLDGRTLYVVQNQLNQVAVVSIAPDLRSATVTDTLTSPHFAVPTTVARIGNRLYLPNAKFGVSNPDDTYEVVGLDRS